MSAIKMGGTNHSTMQASCFYNVSKLVILTASSGARREFDLFEAKFETMRSGGSAELYVFGKKSTVSTRSA
jgi:hypothetical protein